MERQILSDLNPAYSELYLGPLRAEGLKVYTKDQNLDGWIRAVDVFLIYDDEQEWTRAREIIEGMQTP